MKQLKMKLMTKKEDFISMLLGTLGESLLGNMLIDKGINRVGEGFIIAGYESKTSSI